MPEQYTVTLNADEREAVLAVLGPLPEGNPLSSAYIKLMDAPVQCESCRYPVHGAHYPGCRALSDEREPQ